ncbi:MAG: hypothetical protein Q7U23_04650 [Methylococcales bacterium]|nr:hypothetical protein [Methylococcales bacterium]MDP3332683.1 hypothetical protein [Methylococcaceae bacterium]
MNVAGIDVSAKELVVVVSVKSKAGKAKSFENTAAGASSYYPLIVKIPKRSEGLS